LSNVAVYYVEAGDLARAAQLHTEQAAISHRLGDRGAEANALLNLGYDYALLGVYSSARAALEQALPMLQAVDARRESAYAMLNLGLVDWRLGDNDAAQTVIEQAQDALANLGDAFGHAAGLSYRALIFEQAGDMAGAQERFTQARDAFTGMGVRGYATDAMAGLARCALSRSDRDEALRQAGEVWAYMQAAGSQGMEFPIRAYLTCAEVFEWLGESERSRAAIEEGYRDLIRRAEKISTIDWGRSFLENVPEHRSLIEMRDRVARIPTTL
jgi:tetratricopeptide (TPR) repeat protein